MALPAIALTAVSEVGSGERGGKRRADAERSIAAILDAAVEVLSERPTASVTAIAVAAGVTRQTVYAHYNSRAALLAAVAERAMGETVAAIDAAEPERGDPGEALDRLVAAWWERVARHARVLEALAAALPTGAAVHDFHAPVLARIEALVRRGQAAGEFDRGLPAGWLAVAFLGLMHTAAEEVAARRLKPAEAGRALARSVPRMFGAQAPPPA
jgi:AcrR family transcriptional regulator